ncbi:MAG: polymerase sigma-70 factor, subfamily [Frankiaceae bacterium]|jgi:RNA polymerase sigma-70 factor (ECF subfamily)|nr:polymerase sigma-70 factor, subfamily [Frankiaceae bacterium]MDQ1714417.1 polymerase sigma-70 factor, subfamily [Frankiaceae bacterium]
MGEDDAAGAEPTDADLLRLHADGNPDAFATLIRRHQDRLWAVALRTTCDPDEAADALQDALISAHRAAGRFRGESQVTTWLHRIVVNACLDRLRRRQARAQVPLPDDGDTPDTHDAVTQADTAMVVHHGLAQLPDEQRVAIVLVDIVGHSIDEAAAILAVPAGTVKSRCSRGRARLAIVLSDLDPGKGSGNHSADPAVQPITRPTPGGDA